MEKFLPYLGIVVCVEHQLLYQGLVKNKVNGIPLIHKKSKMVVISLNLSFLWNVLQLG